MEEIKNIYLSIYLSVKDSNYNWAATRQNLSSVCPTKLDSNQFTQLQRLAKKNEGSGTIKLSDIFGYLRELKPAIRAIYSEIVTLVIILLEIPAANAASERTFSALRRVKTYLRSIVRIY